MHMVILTRCYTLDMALNNPNPDRWAIEMPLSADGDYITIAAAERLIDYPDLAAVMVFCVGGGDTRLVAHAVAPAPLEFRANTADEMNALYDGWLLRVGRSLAMANDDEAVDTARLTSLTQLTTRILRGITSGDLERWARRQIVTSTAQAKRAVQPGGDRKHRDRRGGGDRRLAEIAARYVELLDQTDKPNPVLVDEFDLSANTVSSYLYRARERGLLTSPGRGRAGGALTPRARALLEGEPS